MTKEDYMQEQIDNNSECLKRLILAIANHQPSLSDEMNYIFGEWNRVGCEIDEEYQQE